MDWCRIYSGGSEGRVASVLKERLMGVFSPEKVKVDTGREQVGEVCQRQGGEGPEVPLLCFREVEGGGCS